jgi:hypothetical protein
VAPQIAKKLVNRALFAVQKSSRVYARVTLIAEIGTKILDVICLLFRLCRPGGTQGLVAEVLLLRQQLLVLKREKAKCPPLIRGVTLFDGTDRIRKINWFKFQLLYFISIRRLVVLSKGLNRGKCKKGS